MFATAKLVPTRLLVVCLPLGLAVSGGCGEDPQTGASADTGPDITVLFDAVLPDTALPVYTDPDSASPDVATPDTASAPDVTAPCPGCAFAPCQDNADCDSGFCLEGPSGQECAKTCSDTCPTGYGCRGVANAAGDPTFVCVYEHITYCQPCRLDSDCELGIGGLSGARCLEGAPGEGSYCRTRCSIGSCPTGAECDDALVGDAALKLCQPVDGACACSQRAINRNASTACSVSNAAGTCAGERVCAVEGLSACDADEPAVEQCNGVDDDCDGATDEDFGELGAACDGAADSDACADGLWVCDADGQLLCTDDPASRVELCNGEDDDCDGLTDEDFALAGSPCDGDDADQCQDGVWACDGFALACSDDAASAVELCNGEDDDCDGQTDEGFADLGKACDGDDADLCKDGALVCAADGLAVVCSDDAASKVELCNGEDDDCDTAVDEGFEQKFQPCDGADGDQCQDGQLVCSLDGSGLVCNDDAASRVELCNNIDDDCDGAVDEDFPGLLTPCDGTDLDQCPDGVRVCSPDQLGTVCTDDATSFVELCNDEDDDCDGEIDETFPTKGQPCDGADADLCTDGVWACASNGLICNDDAASKVELCNGLDDDCDGLTDSLDPDLARPLNANQSGACAGSRKRCAGSAGFVDDYTSVAGYLGAETPDAAFFDDNCDGLDGDVTQAVFVKAGASNNASCTQASPCGSVTWAIGKTAAGKRHVYIQAGTYDEVVHLDREAHLFGGFNAQWVRRPATEVGHKVVLRGVKYVPDGEYLVVRARSATASLSDLVLEAKSPTATERNGLNGLSSYVVHAVSSNLTFNRVELLQGDGASGATGAAGTNASSLTAPPTAAAGGGGTQKVDLCDDSSYGGGGAGASNGACSSGTAGGKGGNGGTMDSGCSCLFGICACFGSDCSARPGTSGVAGSYVSGVSGGGAGGGSNVCQAPGGGGSGGSVHGAGGNGGVRAGAFAGDFWYGGLGAVGAVGKDGAGGGGGGGSGGCDVSQVPLQNSAGAGGGGGGAGGCKAQAAGAGGGAGGSSVGVLVRGGSASFNACRFVLGNGGVGGVGGAGGRGQPGGAAGGGGPGAGSAAAGAAGGAGGPGGHSGGGGGGAGGSAWGVLKLGASVTVSADTVFNGGSGGAGGDGGAAASGAPSAVAGKKGDNGAAEAQRTCASATGC